MDDARFEHPPLAQSDVRILSVAVQLWYRHYDIQANVALSCAVCAAAIGIYRSCTLAADDIAQTLIERFSPHGRPDPMTIH